MNEHARDHYGVPVKLVTPKLTASVAIILKATGHLLATTNRAHGGIALPGGKGELGEDPKQTLIRELSEEVAIEVRGSDLVQVAVGENVHGGAARMIYVYLVLEAQGEPREVEEGTRPIWCPWENLRSQSPFTAFYDRHFPDGVRHLPPTRGLARVRTRTL